MIPCPKCARENDDKALYCDQCRTPVTAEAPAAALAESCPACGGAVREVPVLAAVCGDCGLALGEGGPEAAGAHEAAPSGPAEPEAPESGPATPCPVCGTGNPARAAQCAGCQIAFTKSRNRLECPKCSAETDEEKCGCGAVLTLPKLLGYVDASVRVVCPLCKQLFTRERSECSDCGGPTRPADALKALAAARS